MPISAAELALKRAKGLQALLDLFDARAHPWIFPLGGRASYL